jgi:leucyl-tRNA synthetase
MKKSTFSNETIAYWQDVDLYMGGDEHATGHLLYARFWSMFLYDLGLTVRPEPFRKLINQGKIQGRSNFVYRVSGTNRFVSYGLRKDYETTRLHVDISLVDNDVLNREAFKNWRDEYRDADFVLEDGKYICGWEVEKMSKSKYNVQNPDDLIQKYGADAFRLHEMFFGPYRKPQALEKGGHRGGFSVY